MSKIHQHAGESIRFQRRGRVFEGVVQAVQETKKELWIQVEFEDYWHLFSRQKVLKIAWIRARQVL